MKSYVTYSLESIRNTDHGQVGEDIWIHGNKGDQYTGLDDCSALSRVKKTHSDTAYFSSRHISSGVGTTLLKDGFQYSQNDENQILKHIPYDPKFNIMYFSTGLISMDKIGALIIKIRTIYK